MAKRSIVDEGKDAFASLTGGDAQDVQDTQAVINTDDTDETQIEYKRLNLRLPKYIIDYLKEAAFAESTPTRRVSVTGYIVELVEKDMRDHGKA